MIFIVLAFIVGILVGIGITYGDERYIKWRQRRDMQKWEKREIKKLNQGFIDMGLQKITEDEEAQKVAEDIKEFWEDPSVKITIEKLKAECRKPIHPEPEK